MIWPCSSLVHSSVNLEMIKVSGCSVPNRQLIFSTCAPIKIFILCSASNVAQASPIPDVIQVTIVVFSIICLDHFSIICRWLCDIFAFISFFTHCVENIM
ncbi:hypothetical protein Mapa_012094 [Marchantia paleacea]|nr:hypothetical protein Mapa_012094 [Marchantia paleacea]